MRGRLTYWSDEGTLIHFLIKREDGWVDSVSGDANLTRAALEESGVQLGDEIEYEVNEWGGLEWFRPLDDEEG